MSCEYVRPKISSLLDDGLREEERRQTLAHLESCGSCRDEYQALERQRLAMRSMRNRMVPAVVTNRLRVLASHERSRRLMRSSLSTWMRHVADEAHLFMDNMMRPLALPFGGGVLSAVLLFSILAPGLIFTRSRDFDPSVVSHVTLPQARLRSFPLAGGGPANAPGEVVSVEMAGFVNVEMDGAIPPSSDTTLVELTVDRYGHILDWKMLQGELTREVKSVIVSSSFDPGTYFGVPTDSKVLVSLHSVHGAART